jgi:retinol-binding protein 3
VLIVDLRQNTGGNPDMVQFLTSYLFGGEPVHLNSLYWRPRDSTDQFWTMPYVPGRRFGPDKKVYVLTSDRTFSAAEEFTYNLQTRQRATVVGDTTGGGAHPGGPRRVSEHFGVWVPSGRAINPVTSTNWEGTGVRPDVPVPTDQALQVAYVAALRDILASLADEQRRPGLERLIADQQKKLDDMRAALPAAPSNP